MYVAPTVSYVSRSTYSSWLISAFGLLAYDYLMTVLLLHHASSIVMLWYHFKGLYHNKKL